MLITSVQRLCRVITSIESGDSEGAGRLLDDMLQGELELFRKGGAACGQAEPKGEGCPTK